MPKQISKKTKTNDHTVDSLAKDLAQFRKEMNLLWRDNDERWEANDKRWDANDKRWDANDKRWDANDKRWDANDKRWEANDKRWDANDKRWDANDKRWDELNKWQNVTDRNFLNLMKVVQDGFTEMRTEFKKINSTHIDQKETLRTHESRISKNEIEIESVKSLVSIKLP